MKKVTVSLNSQESDSPFQVLVIEQADMKREIAVKTVTLPDENGATEHVFTLKRGDVLKVY